MNMKKIVAVASALSLTAAIAVGGTLAYLQAQTKSVKNNFTYVAADQNVTLALYEHELAENDNLHIGDVKKYAGETGYTQEYTIVPGATAEKDPTLELKSGNTKVYVYAEIVTKDTADAIKQINMPDGKWTLLEDVKSNTSLSEGETSAVYVLTESANGQYSAPEMESLQVFTSVEYNNLADSSQDITSGAVSIAVYGYAVDVNAKGATGTDASDAFVGAGFGTAVNPGV